MNGADNDRLDATDLMIEVARQIEAVGLAMRVHRVVITQQVCACGRLATKLLPMFGLRCDVAYQQWKRAQSSLQRIHNQMSADNRAVGRSRSYPL